MTITETIPQPGVQIYAFGQTIKSHIIIGETDYLLTDVGPSVTNQGPAVPTGEEVVVRPEYGLGNDHLPKLSSIANSAARFCLDVAKSFTDMNAIPVATQDSTNKRLTIARATGDKNLDHPRATIERDPEIVPAFVQNRAEGVIVPSLLFVMQVAGFKGMKKVRGETAVFVDFTRKRDQTSGELTDTPLLWVRSITKPADDQSD